MRDIRINFESADGQRVYERSVIQLLVMAVRDLYPGRRVMIRHSVRYDIYFEVEGDSELLPEEVSAIEKKMRELSCEKIPFSDINQKYGELVPDSGYITGFSLLYRYPGAVLMVPRGRLEQEKATRHAMYKDVPKLIAVFSEYKNWGRILGIENISEYNRVVKDGGARDIIRVAEALQEKNISSIADAITNSPERRKIVFVAGPSSSGKTTFANRLSIQLRVNGYKTTIISMDDYYKNREDIPRLSDGSFDLECPEALDIELFTRQMKCLSEGGTVNAPIYNFQKSGREDFTRVLSVEGNQILIVEGIHGLNPKISSSVPKELKYKIYISALTSLNIDDLNRIPTTDTRLIRRIVRDHQFRGTNAAETIGMWRSVRAGEEEHIFPFQESCDSMFNSGLIYELGAMKAVAMTLLAQIERDQPEYREAERLSRFLSYFEAAPVSEIPRNSILREFLGGSCF